MRDFLYIGSSPSEETCVGIGVENYTELARAECKRFIEVLRKVHGPEPKGAELKITANPHDFGTYYEVVCWFDDTYPESVDYAYKVEAETPLTWEV